MDRLAVASGNVESVGYDGQEMKLEVKFRRGGRYCYFGVPLSVFEDLLKAESPGAFLNQQIRDVYSYQKISPSEASQP